MPNRTIKESIKLSEDYNNMTLFQRDMFIRLIVSADDFGRLDARTTALRSMLYPLGSVSEKTVEENLQSLASMGIILLYEAEGQRYLYFPTWGKHQRTRAKSSRYPSPRAKGTCPFGKCRYSFDNKQIECINCPIAIRAREIDELYRDLFRQRMKRHDVLQIARILIDTDIDLVRKAVLLAYHSEADDTVKYLYRVAQDWKESEIKTLKQFKERKLN